MNSSTRQPFGGVGAGPHQSAYHGPKVGATTRAGPGLFPGFVHHGPSRSITVSQSRPPHSVQHSGRVMHVDVGHTDQVDLTLLHTGARINVETMLNHCSGSPTSRSRRSCSGC
jgi:hypothetical protein